MTQHTPGPWNLQPVHDGWAAFAPSLGHNPSRTVFQCRNSTRADAEAAANARLLAQAPELLAVAKKLIEYETHTKDGNELDAALAYAAASDIARAAIAKAEGRS